MATIETVSLSQMSPSGHIPTCLHSTSPRSALRHRPILPANETNDQEPPRVPRASRTQKIGREQDKSGSATPARSAGKPAPSTGEREPSTSPPLADSTQPKTRVQQHWLVLLGTGMVIALLAVLAAQATLGWLSTTWDDIHYGRPRTFQTDAFVGHESGQTPSHFMVVNLHGQIYIIELPGGDATHTRIFIGPQLVGSGADLVPATIHFVDTHHDHHPDLYLQAGSIQVIYHNTNGTFTQS